MEEKEGQQERVVGKDGEFAKRAKLFHRLIMDDFDFVNAARTQSGSYGQANISTNDVKSK